MMGPRFVILGGGPTGLGAAWRLQERGVADWHLVDALDAPGGLARSFVDPQGFTWDLGGHVLFSHYEYFDRVMDEVLCGAWLEHARESYVWIRERLVPYPLQNNIRHLPPCDLAACLDGLLDVHDQRAEAGRLPPPNYREWLLRQYGCGLANLFMLPYNHKVWACDPALMDVGWMGERVSPVDLRRVIRNVALQQDDEAWGPNARFRFPCQGGTGAIWKAVAAKLPSERLALGNPAVGVLGREVHLADGTVLPYDFLLSTIPLDRLVSLLADPADGLRQAARRLVYSGSHIIGVGLAGQPPPPLRSTSWMYFPEDNVPFYRVTVFSNYAPANVARPGQQWSLMAEVSESRECPVDAESIAAQVVSGLSTVLGIDLQGKLESLWHTRLEHGYPTPFLGRDGVIGSIHEGLQALGIYSRGRFGGWKYEVANQDHSFMQGLEVVDHLLTGSEEVTFMRPDVVNGGGKMPLPSTHGPQPEPEPEPGMI